MHKIEAVWGTCDGHGIVFTQVSNDIWTCDVPADLSDGKYIVELYARNQSGMTIYTTAILYMFDSKCVSLELINDGVYVVFGSSNLNVKLLDDVIDVCMVAYSVKLLEDMMKVVILCD